MKHARGRGISLTASMFLASQISSGCAVLVGGGAAAGTAASAHESRKDDHSPMTYAGTVLANAVYCPAKVVFAGVGAVTSGAAYVFTLGRAEPASSIWNTAVGGDYVLTPDMIEGREPVEFAAAQRPALASDTQRDERSVQGEPSRRIKAKARHTSTGKATVPRQKAPPAPAARASYSTLPARSVRIVVHGVRFDPAGEALRHDSRSVLDEAARLAQRSPGAEIVVPTRSVAARRSPDLRARREAAVRAYLAQRGATVETVALQFTHPEARDSVRVVGLKVPQEDSAR